MASHYDNSASVMLNNHTKIYLKKIFTVLPFLGKIYQKYLVNKKEDYFFKKIEDSLVVYQKDDVGIKILDEKNFSKNINVLPNFLVIKSGRYLFYNRKFDCSRPGLYRFVNPQTANRQHVVLSENNSILNALLLSFLSIRGNKDNLKNVEKLKFLAVSRLLSITCTVNCSFCHDILTNNGFNSRIVHSYTLENLNSYNNGHALLEVYCKELQKFVVIDLDKKATFFSENTPLSLFELCKAIFDKKAISIKFYSNATLVDWSNFIERRTSFNYDFLEFQFYDSRNNVLESIKRICQVPMMISEGEMVVCGWNVAQAKKLKSIDPSWKIIDPSAFFTKFYR